MTSVSSVVLQAIMYRALQRAREHKTLKAMMKLRKLTYILVQSTAVMILKKTKTYVGNIHLLKIEIS